MRHTVFYIFGQLAALVFADNYPKLAKAPLSDSLAYLHDGLVEHLSSPAGEYSKWDPGWIPFDCKETAESKNLTAIDIEVYNVHYDDCDTPWIICRHKDSIIPVGELLEHFARVPVRGRSYVRHIIDLPDHTTTNNYAFNQRGNIALFNKAAATTAVLIHETGHSLDLLGAYRQQPLSSSQTWAAAYGNDSNVPDGYAGSNVLEDVAQSTVVAAFDLNVPGGFRKVQKGWRAIYHQYSTIETAASQAGQQFSPAGSLLMPGGRCGQRLGNSAPARVLIPIQSKGAMRSRAAGSMPPDVSLPDHIEAIKPVEFHTGKACSHTS